MQSNPLDYHQPFDPTSTSGEESAKGDHKAGETLSAENSVFVPVEVEKTKPKPRIMCVDDDREITDLYSLIFNKYGYSVSHVAYDGLEAIKIIEEDDDIDILIIDQRMPKIDGISAAAKIRSLKPNLKIIVVSAYDQPEFEKDSFDAILTKPISMKELIDVIVKLS